MKKNENVGSCCLKHNLFWPCILPILRAGETDVGEGCVMLNKNDDDIVQGFGRNKKN